MAFALGVSAALLRGAALGLLILGATGILRVIIREMQKDAADQTDSAVRANALFIAVAYILYAFSLI